MYVLVRSRYRADRRNGRWKDANLANELVTTLSANYGDIYLYIQYPGPGEAITKVLRWDNVVTQLSSVDPSVTVQQWLTAIGNQTLPFESKIPSEDVRLVKYAQAWHCGYSLQPVARQGHVDAGGSSFHKEDLLMVHPTHSPKDVYEKALITVNGFFHLCDYTSAGLRIIDGNTTLRKGNDNQVGIYSFEKIGNVKYVPITDSMVSGQNAEAPLWDGTYVTIPEGVDIENKTVLLVTGGYLSILSEDYQRVGSRTWRVRFGAMMFLDRYFDSYYAMDLSSLGLTIDPENPTLFKVDELKNDSVIRKYMTLSQSFLIVVDSPSFFQEYEQVEYLNLPGRFIDSKYDRMPLVGAYGKMLDYHVIKEPKLDYIIPKVENQYVYCAVQNRRNHYDANTRPWPQQRIVDSGRYPAWRFRHETAYYRVFGVEG